MRKVLWCGLAVGAAVGCAVGTAVYVSRNPDSALGRCAVVACQAGARATGVSTSAFRPATAGPAETDDLIPADPVPVDAPPPPTPGSHVPPEVAALMAPPIIIHDEEDLNAATGPNAKPEFSASARVDVETLRPSTIEFASASLPADGDAVPEAKQPAGPPIMPYCADDEGPAPRMPYCTEDETTPVMPAVAVEEEVRKESSAGYRQFDACAFWMGFFSGPSRMFSDPTAARCEEDAHYSQQYPGVPYIGQPCSVEQPAQTDLKPPTAFPGVDEPSEPPAPKDEKHPDPRDLFNHPHGLKMPRPAEPESDTMEMRPSDWKPYSLDPGPF